MDRKPHVGRPIKHRVVQIAVTAVLLLGGMGYLFYTSLAGATQHYKMVDELMMDADVWVGRTLRVHGWVEAGSIQETIVGQVTQRTFVLENKGARIRVLHTGPTPDTFRDQSEVVAKGTVQVQDGDHLLNATELTAKCPSKYEGQPKTDGSYEVSDKPLF